MMRGGETRLARKGQKRGEYPRPFAQGLETSPEPRHAALPPQTEGMAGTHSLHNPLSNPANALMHACASNRLTRRF